MNEEIRRLKRCISDTKRAKALIGEAQGIMRGLGVTIDSEVEEACDTIDRRTESFRRELGMLVEMEP